MTEQSDRFDDYTYISSYMFKPYHVGPTFTLYMWDTKRRGSYGKCVYAYRLTMSPDVVLFEGFDFESHAKPGSNEMVSGIMGFLTLKPGDTDSEYFEGYTQAQLDYANAHAEALSLEVLNRYGED